MKLFFFIASLISSTLLATNTPLMSANLVCQKSGPKEALPNQLIHYQVIVTNKGPCVAEEVTLTENLAEGLRHTSGMRSLCYKLGRLAPLESRLIAIPLSTIKRGHFTSTAVLTACNGKTTSCNLLTTIGSRDFELEKNGPKEGSVGKNEEYELSVINTGDLPLTNLLITDSVPFATKIVSAKGATVQGREAIWKLSELKPSEKATFNITLTTCTPGTFTNRASATTSEGLQRSTESRTRWKGEPLTTAQMRSLKGPICKGEKVSYIITLVNEGPEPDKNVEMRLRFPNQVQATTISGDLKGSIRNNEVVFEKKETLFPKQRMTVRVEAQGKESGAGQVKLEVTSNASKLPVFQEETLRVY
jgi:uncharacterized repeat protein (TIGR01451 family)